jgi:hypothetical protein
LLRQAYVPEELSWSDMKFTNKTKEHLRFYVYGLVDPRDNKIFYVGKASANNRVFDHLATTASESRKSLKIDEIRAAKRQPQIEILRYGLESERVALEVEAAIIDALGLENLTNAVRGHGVEHGRMLAQEVERLHGSVPIKVSEIRERCMLFYIHNTYSPTLSEQEIYDCIRQFWHGVSARNRSDPSLYPVGLGVVEGVVVRACSIAAWFPAGTTFSSRPYNDIGKDRWEFVGQKLDKHPLLGRLLVDDQEKPIAGVQKGYSYLPRE